MEIAKLPMISLQRQALTNFASSVWISANKQYLRVPMNDRAIAKLERSNIAEHIKEMTMMILDDVGGEIYYWLHEIKDHVNDTTLEHQVANLSWTIEGPLNRPKMARLILENQSDLDLSFSFKMACTYGLENVVVEIWPRLKEVGLECFDEYGNNFMLKYWIYKLDGRLLEISDCMPELSMYLDTMSVGVKFLLGTLDLCKIETAKFLFNKLSEEEKAEALNIFKSASTRLFTFISQSVYEYLMCQLNFEQICDIISELVEQPTDLLLKTDCLACPNSEVLKAIDHSLGKMKGTMETTNGADLLELADGALWFVRHYNRRILFRYCWTRFPKEELNKAIEYSTSTFLSQMFRHLSYNNDAVSIKMVIDSIDPKGFAKNLLTGNSLDIMIYLGQYDTNLLKYYLARNVGSKNLAKVIIEKTKYSSNFERVSKKISGVLIQLFPSLDPNCID